MATLGSPAPRYAATRMWGGDAPDIHRIMAWDNAGSSWIVETASVSRVTTTVTNDTLRLMATISAASSATISEIDAVAGYTVSDWGPYGTDEVQLATTGALSPYIDLSAGDTLQITFDVVVA